MGREEGGDPAVRVTPDLSQEECRERAEKGNYITRKCLYWKLFWHDLSCFPPEHVGVGRRLSKIWHCVHPDHPGQKMQG